MAQSYIDLSSKEEFNYYDYYKNKYCNEINTWEAYIKNINRKNNERKEKFIC